MRANTAEPRPDSWTRAAEAHTTEGDALERLRRRLAGTATATTTKREAPKVARVEKLITQHETAAAEIKAQGERERERPRGSGMTGESARRAAEDEAMRVAVAVMTGSSPGPERAGSKARYPDTPPQAWSKVESTTIPADGPANPRGPAEWIDDHTKKVEADRPIGAVDGEPVRIAVDGSGGYLFQERLDMILDGCGGRKGPADAHDRGSTPRTAEGRRGGAAAEEPEERPEPPEGLQARPARGRSGPPTARRHSATPRLENDGKQAGVLRNEWMLKEGRPHLVVVFRRTGRTRAGNWPSSRRSTGTPVEMPTTSAAPTRSTTRPPPTTSRPSARR